MKAYQAVVTPEGQVTIPAEVQEVLGIKEGDRVAWVLEDGHARLERSGSVVARTAGILKSDAPPLTEEQLNEVVELAIAEDVMKSMGG